MTTPQTIDVGAQKQLFIDDRWFFSQNGMQLRVNPPVKTERILAAEKPWEAMRLCGGSFLEDNGEYKLWYGAFGGGDEPHARSVCYAVSPDGLNWERRNTGLFEWDGSRQNNIVMPGAHAGVMIDPNGPDEHRYKAVAIIKENDMWPESKGCVTGYWEGKRFHAVMELYLCTSPDGINWTRQQTAVSDYFHDTSNHFFYDRVRAKYAAYVRTHTRGRTVGRLEFDDPMDLPWIPLGAEDKAQFFPTVLSADETDPPQTDLYTPCVHQYPWAADAYFSFTTPYRHYPVGDAANTALAGKDERGRFQNDGCVDIQLAVSRDGVNFIRPDRRPYVPLGLQGSWDGGQIYMSLGFIRQGDEIWQYYHGTAHTHGAYTSDENQYYGAICRLVQRLDGFVSADADYTGGEFTTPLLTFTGEQLQLNVDCSALGQVWVEVRDEHNHAIPGYTMADAIDVDRNQTAAPVSWREREDVAELVGRPVRLHFKLRACKLYAFQFVAG